MPNLWTAAVEAHRREVRDAVLQTTAELVAERGLRAVTMSEIAERAGIGRATLYKYFPDVESILLAWHQGKIASHFEQLFVLRDLPGNAGERLRRVLETYALIVHQTRTHHDAELAAFLHRDQQVAQAQTQLGDLVRGLLAAAAEAGEVREDVASAELATYCLSALAAAGSLPSQAAVHRLVAVTLAGLRPNA